MNIWSGRSAARAIALAALGVVMFAMWGASALAQPQPLFRLYGEGESGNVVTVYDERGDLKGLTTVTSSNVWYIDVECAADMTSTLRFTVNGELVNAELRITGQDQASVNLTVLVSEPESEMMQEDSMMDEGEMTDEDGMMMGDEQMVESYPESGSGGLADGGVSTAALIGVGIVALALVLGLGARRPYRRGK